MQFYRQKLENDSVRIDGNSFIECTFENLILIYSGGPPVKIVSCNFGNNVKWKFDGAAGNTLEFLRTMHQDGAFREVVEANIAWIRENPPRSQNGRNQAERK